MLLKILGSLVILVSSSFLGFALSDDCKKRPQQLRELQLLLQMLENSISFLSEVLTDAFDKIYAGNKSEVGIFFAVASEKMKTGKNLNAEDAWKAAVTENINKTALDKEDEEILATFGKMLGSSDIDGQIKNIRLVTNQLKLQEEKAEKKRAKNEKMYQSLGILGGIAIIISLM